MNRLSSRCSLALAIMLLQACVDDDPLPRDSPVADAGAPEPSATANVSVAPVLPPDCAPIFDPLPSTLSCTGLYGAAGAGSVEKSVHPAARSFAPGKMLWTDAADKQRWISLPQGKQIDTSSPNGWVF